MVQVASLRIQIDAQQANTAAREVKRNLDEVTVAATKTEVSTDKLERQMAELLAVTSRVATNTHASAVAIQQLGQRQATAGVQVERTTERIVKQEAAGSRLIRIFGGLAARTAATGGAFLAVDFLARVAGATSLMGALNDVLDATAGKVREWIGLEVRLSAEMQSRADQIEKVRAAYAELRAEREKEADRVQVGNRTFSLLGIQGADREEALEQVRKFAEAQKKILELQDRGIQPNRFIEQERFLLQQADPARLEENLNRLRTQSVAYAEEQKQAEESLKQQAKAAQEIQTRLDAAGREWQKALAGGRAIRSRNRLEQAGSDFATPFALAGINAGQSYLQAQGFANQGQTGESAGAGGNAWLNAMVGASAQYAANLARIVDGQERARRSAEQFGQTAAGAFEDAVFSARSFEEGLEMVARSLVRVIFNQLVTQQLANGIASLFPSAKGNVFSGGDVVPFASGGIVSGPTVFPMRGGKTGLMGEAGPEAIMPLGRNSRGELGVKGGGGTTVVFNITTPDAQSFRKSQKQIRSDIRRLVG